MSVNIYDVLVIGSGGAGLSAALEAKQNGAEVIVVSKTYPTHSQTCQAQGGINAAIDGKVDSIESHIADTLKGSRGLGDFKSIELMCKKAPETIKWLDSLGVPFSRTSENKVAQRKFGAASKIRTCYSSDYTGLKILHTLYDNCIKQNIPFKNEHILLELITKNDVCLGAVFYELKTGEVKRVLAKKTILATGGFANIYNQFTTNSHATTGDGIVAAYHAGCQLSNMEMVQFHPTALKGNNILISESARGEGGYLVDEKGNRFIDELKPRDEVARAIYTKINNGEEVFLDLRHIPLDVLNNVMPQEKRLAQELLGIDITKELLPINPAAHYCMGGIKTNVSCETSLKNLYACGECAQSGVHGANRLGGNSLQEIVTFGRIAGEHATKNLNEPSTQSETTPLRSELLIEKLFNSLHSSPVSTAKKELGKHFFNKLGLYREEKNMNELKVHLDKLSNELDTFGIKDKSKVFNQNIQEYLEFKNLIELGKIIVASAIERKESRGAHYRTDYVNMDPKFKKESIVTNKDGKISITFESLT